MIMFFSPFRNDHKKLAYLLKQRMDLANAYEDAKENKNPSAELLSKNLDSICNQIDEYIENEYAYDVFQYYSEKNPTLILVKDGSLLQWIDAFGTSFNKVPKTLRHSLVGLIEGTGRYKLKQ